MRLPHLRPVRRPRTAPATRSAFTLIELIIVILVMLILMTLTVALVGDVLDSGRVSGAARQIQNYLAGARDRAIYSASRTDGQGVPPRVGVRFLSDPSLIVPNGAGRPTPRGFSSMVFVQDVDPMLSTFRIYKDPVSGNWFASQLPSDPATPADPTDTIFPAEDDVDPLIPNDGNPAAAVGELIKRGLVRIQWEDPDGDGNYDQFCYLQLTFILDQNNKNYYVRFPRNTTSLSADPSGVTWLAQGELFVPPPPAAVGVTKWKNHLRPAPLPNEEPRLLPTGTVIEVLSSRAGTTPLLPLLTNGSYDVMFNAQGVVDGPLASAGLLHLYVADLEDIERGFTSASPYADSDTATAGIQPADSDGDGEFDTRRGDVRVVSLRTRTGNAYSSEIRPAIDTATFLYTDPFFYAETGAEAQ